MPITESFFLIFVGLVLGVLVHWLWRRGESSKIIGLEQDRARLASSVESLGRQLSQEQTSRAAAEERASRVAVLEMELRGFVALREEHAKVVSTMEVESRQASEKMKLLMEARE